MGLLCRWDGELRRCYSAQLAAGLGCVDFPPPSKCDSWRHEVAVLSPAFVIGGIRSKGHGAQGGLRILTA